MKKNQKCNTCEFNSDMMSKKGNINDDNISEKDLSISIAQAKFLVSIGHRMLNGAEMSIGTKFYVKDNWGDPDHFKKLCFSDEPNQLSLIIHFLKLKDELNKVPTREDIKNESKFQIKEFRKKFGSWSSFLNLLGEDPWYRNQKIERRYHKKSKPYEEQLLEVKENRIAMKQENEKQNIENEKQNIEMKIKSLETKSKIIESEIMEGLESVINTLEMELKDNKDGLKKLKSLEKFVDLLSVKKINELKYSIR